MPVMTPKKKKKKDLFDHLESFVEGLIDKHMRKGLSEVEHFLKKEVVKSPENRQKVESVFNYLDAFLKDPKVASVAPSTKFVVARVLKMIDWTKTKVIIEYGPAGGVITRQLLERLPEDGTLIAVETNEKFVDILRKDVSDPRLKVVHGSVLDLPAHLAPLNVGPADAIVSGIPFSFLKPIERHQLLHKTEEALRPGGRFIAYQFTTHLVPLLKFHFEKVDVQFEVRNIPPHFIFTGFK